MTLKMLKRFLVGAVIGVALLPAFISCFLLYTPYIFGVDPVFGGAITDVIQSGYVITEDDVKALKKLSEMIDELAYFGVLIGLIFGAIGIGSVFVDKKNGFIK